jgi:alpha-mannosidase
LDAPVVSLAGLWPDYLSPAHRCHVDERLRRPPVSFDALAANGWIYSNVAQNNLGTNFSCAQVGDLLFRYVLTTRQGALTDAQTALWARQAVSPLTTIFTEGPHGGALPARAGFLEVASDEVVLLAGKRAEDGRGLLLRLWNLAKHDVTAPVRFPLSEIAEVYRTNLLEEDQGPALPSGAHEFTVEIGARGVAAVRVLLRPEAGG